MSQTNSPKALLNGFEALADGHFFPAKASSPAFETPKYWMKT
jgi:hypothetical protein